jgi:cytochrome c oxidase subunit 2
MRRAQQVVLNQSARTGRLGRALRLALGAALLSTVLSGCTTQEALRFGWPEGVTPEAERMRDLWTGSVIAALIVGVLVWGLIFWVVVRYRKRGDELPVQTRFNLPIEILYTVAPFLIIAVLFYYTAIVQTRVTEQEPNPDVTVAVVGFKWNWQFRYPQEMGQNDQPVETTGTSEEVPILVLPTGKRIHFEERSNDVIHSFWVPDMLFKRDVIPGRQNSFDITRIDKAGSYVGRCAELCGTYHAFMNFEVRAVSPSKYDQYIQARKAGDSTADALRKIGEPPLAVKTHPFNTDRTLRTSS